VIVCVHSYDGAFSAALFAALGGMETLRPKCKRNTTSKLEGVLRQVYSPDGINLGMNVGRAAGAGVAGHIHMHVLPRWVGDTNFMTTTAETRVLPESLDQTYERLKRALDTP